MNDAILSRIAMVVTAQIGLRFPPDRWGELARGIASAALELGIADLDGWMQALAEGSATIEQLNALANHLTISETYFFRQRDAFDALAAEILPQRLVVRREARRSLRLWSAGCASGEEPYSIAILLREQFPELAQGGASIAATDINSRVLARAARGVYTEWSFRDAPEWLKERYFTRVSASRFELDADIRRMVRFSALNLAAPQLPAEFGPRGDFDVILCRNVLMYFSAEWQEKIVQRFAEALTPGGWLIVGPCDITAAQSAELHLRARSPGIYRKSDGAREEEKPAPAMRPITPLAWSPPEPVVAVPLPPIPVAELAYPETPFAGGVETSAGIAPAQPSEAPARAQAHADRGELAEALAACEEAIALDPLDAHLHYLRGCILQEQGRREEAARAFRQVLFLDSGVVMAEFALGALAEREGQMDRARRHFANVLQLLASRNRGETVAQGDGLTVGRLRDVVEKTLEVHAA